MTKFYDVTLSEVINSFMVVLLVVLVFSFFIILTIKGFETINMQDCSKQGLTYFSGQGITFCGNITEMKELVNEIYHVNNGEIVK